VSDTLAKTAGDPATALGIPVGLVDTATTGDDVMDSMIAEIAAAGSVEDALRLGTVAGLQDYDGQTLTFVDFHYQPSTFDTSPNAWPFVVIKAADANGERITATTGAKIVVALLAKARQDDAFPFTATVQVNHFETDAGEHRKAVRLVFPE
jgi:hypothetical protein